MGVNFDRSIWIPVAVTDVHLAFRDSEGRLGLIDRDTLLFVSDDWVPDSEWHDGYIAVLRRYDGWRWPYSCM